MADYGYSNTQLLETMGFAPTDEQRQILTELIGAITFNSPEGVVKELGSQFFVEGRSEGIKMLLTIESHRGGFTELSVLLPMRSGRKVYMHLFATQDDSGRTDFMSALACDGKGAITGVQTPAMRECMLTLFSLLPNPFQDEMQEARSWE